MPENLNYKHNGASEPGSADRLWLFVKISLNLALNFLSSGCSTA